MILTQGEPRLLEKIMRDQYQKYFVNSVAKLLSRFTFITPNRVSLFSAVVGLLVLLALYCKSPWLALLLMWFSGYLDTLDGSIARLTKTFSNKGSVIDICSDRFVETCIIIGLFLIAPYNRGLYCLLIMASSYLCITSFLVVSIFSDNDSSKSFYYSPGLMERAEAFIFFSLMMIVPILFAFWAILYTVLVLWTAARRLWEFNIASKLS